MKKLISLFLILLSVADGRCASVVVPNGFQSGEGNAANIFPFGIMGTNTSMRYQQIYDASQFSQAPNGGWITEIDFRVDSTTGYGFLATLHNLQINLSTTTKEPDGLSSIFSDNLGSDDTLVFGPGQLRMSSGIGGAPQPFDIRITLSTPFLYYPSAGNLLLDVRNYQGSLPEGGRFPPGFDAHSITNDSISRMYADSVNATSATLVNTLGLITQFQMIPIPEPSPLTLLLLGGGSFGVFVHFRKRRKSGQRVFAGFSPILPAVADQPAGGQLNRMKTPM